MATAVETNEACSRPPTGAEVYVDRGFRVVSSVFAWMIVLLTAGIILRIGVLSLPAMREYGLGFITGDVWDPNAGVFGILPQIWGTIYTSVLGLIFGMIFGLAVAIFLSESLLSMWLFNVLARLGLQYHPFFGKLPDALENTIRNIIQLLAAIPSVVYGLWGIFVVIPTITPACEWLHSHLGWIPLFSEPWRGTPSILPASIVLGIMILPTISAISFDALRAVHPRIREAAYGLGATRWEALLGVIIPTASTGIFGSVILAFGRALGETMALAMLAGGANTLKISLFSPANTLAALLASNFGEASGENDIGRLMYASLVLLAITLIVNVAGAWVLTRQNARREGLR
ncbi:MAG: phosphate ABC transporter permease subunit PstC [Planctomycetota bacterium]